MINHLRDILKKTSSDYAEIRWEEININRINYLGKDLEEIGEVENIGGCVRVLIGGGWGFVSFNRAEDIERALKIAENIAGKIKREKVFLSKIKPVISRTRHFPSNISLKEKHKIIKSYNDIILSYPNIMSSQVRFREVIAHKYFVNSDKVEIKDERQETALRLSAIAKEGMNVQTISYDKGILGGFDIVRGLEEKAKEISCRAQALLKASPVLAGKYTVVIDEELAGLFAHEAFGHLSEADFLYENPHLQKLMRIGKKFGDNGLNIIDDATIPKLPGTRKYDDEGVKTKKVYLVKDGVFCGMLHNRETAQKMGYSPSGSARALNYLFPPIIRMSNTYIEGGKTSFEEIIQDIKYGIYAKGSRGGQTNGEMFTFNAAEGYLIENGKITKMLRDITLTGNVFETLHNIEMLSNQVKFFGSSIGGCGKDGQGPLPVSFGGPQMKIKDVVIGGK